MDRIGLVLHPKRDTDEVVDSLRGWADRVGVQLCVLDEGDGRVPPGLEGVDRSGLATGSDVLVAVGGDGTVLTALSLGAPQRVPVLGVNVGRLGYLAEVDPPQLHSALSSIERGEFAVEERGALRLIPGEGCPLEGDVIAYNDVVLARLPGHGQAGIELTVDGEVFARYSVDALVVSSPTGSTAYNFSAGGPIVSPRLAGLVVTPVAPHAVFNRALVLSTQERVELSVLATSDRLHIEADGRSLGETPPRSHVEVGVSPFPGLVIRLGHTSFVTRARRKLRLTDPRELDA